jgi:hypothetical protein
MTIKAATLKNIYEHTGIRFSSKTNRKAILKNTQIEYK